MKLNIKTFSISIVFITGYSLLIESAFCQSETNSLNNNVAKIKSIRKTQEVDFEEANLKGTIRNPDGVYLVQKRGIKFISLFSIHKNLDTKIKSSALYVE